MKSILFFFTFSLVWSFSDAQVMESSKTMSKGAQSSISIEIPDVNPELTEDVFKDYFKNYRGKTKKDKKLNEWFSDDAKVPAIANGAPIDIYSKIEGAGSKTMVTMWVDLGQGFISSGTYPGEYAAATKLLTDFGKQVRISSAENDLAAMDKDAKKLDNDLKRLKRDNDDLHKEIDKCNDKIKQAQNDIVKNEDDQKAKQKAIVDQSSKMDQAKAKLADLKKM